MFVILRKNGIEIPQDKLGTCWSLGFETIPKSSMGNNGIITINKRSNKSVMSRQKTNRNMNRLGRKIK
jgi:hypothetical protein